MDAQKARYLESLLQEVYLEGVVARNRVMRPYMDDDGIMTMGLFEFLLDPNSLER